MFADILVDPDFHSVALSSTDKWMESLMKKKKKEEWQLELSRLGFENRSF
jgi:hypothetical protein